MTKIYSPSKIACLVFAVIVVGALMAGVAHASISTTTNQITYVWGDSLVVTGTLSSVSAISVSAIIYNSTGVVATLATTSSGDSANTFSVSTAINSTHAAGDYVAVITGGTDSMNMSFRVIPSRVIMELYPVKSGDDIINISTTTEITAGGALGGNFTELLQLSKTNKIHYGNSSIGGKLYYFVLVDQTNASSYDRLYIDDDKDFSLYNDTEDNATCPDVEYQALKRSSVFSNGTGSADFKYVVGDIEHTTGDKILLWKVPENRPNTDESTNFIILTKNDTNMISTSVKVEVINSMGQNVTSIYYSTSSQFGWLNVSVPPLSSGTYSVKLNNSMASLTFSVEAFEMFATIADLSGSPAYSFSPDSKVRLLVTSKNSTGSFNLSSFTATLYYPNGTTLSKSKSDFTVSADGVYTIDYDLSGASTGMYGVSVTGTDASGNTQGASTGFEVKSVDFQAEAINTKYIEDADSAGAMVNAFPPLSNVTLMTFLSNISAGGMSAKGSEDDMPGLINPGNCSSVVTLTEITDENGVAYSPSYQVMNLSDALDYLDISGEQPPPGFLSQCMVIFTAPNMSGSVYRAKIKINYNGEEKHTGVTFGVQRLLARGDTVDFKGDDFSFFAPNSTVRIKLKVTDLVTDEELPSENITSAKIIELQRVFPTFSDLLANSTLRDSLNENMVNGTINFTSPVDEGFYIMKFRFTASVNGTVESGIGDAFFMLKKYMVWGELSGAEDGSWYVKQGQNISLSVTVLDIDKAQSVFGGYSSQKTCTDCGGFVVNVSEVRNDQQFKMVTDYTVQVGTIINVTNPVATLTIVPGSNMQPGWYSIDLSVTNPATNATYFGWGWFEVRNFWVDLMKVKWDNGNYTMSESEGHSSTYPVGDDITFAVMAKEPSMPDLLSPDTVTVESVQWFVGWPPVPVSGYSASAELSSVLMCMGSENCQSMPAYVVTISDIPQDKQGDFQANVKVTIDGVSDIGSFWFDVSSYQAETEYRMDSWPPLYSNEEKLIVNFTGADFSTPPNAHNLTNISVEELFDEKHGRPVKMKYGENYTAVCSSNFCTLEMNLSGLASGEYFTRFRIVDYDGVPKSGEAFFKIQNVVISVPTIEEAWLWETDTVSKKVDNNIMRAEWSGCGNSRNDNTGEYLFCGDYHDGSQHMFNLSVQNVTYQKEMFGYVPMMDSWMAGRFGSQANKSRMCLYANGSHMWINATFDGNCNLTQTQPVALNGMFEDGNGGIWRLDALGDQSITITGNNTLYKTGVFINTSYSKSGVVKLGQISESHMGAYTPQGRKGIDLDADGYTNGTMYFAITDNALSGVYDTFFFSADGNFTTPISVNNNNRTEREFGNSQLTLLSIDPRAQSLRFYSKQVGDWAHMGDIKMSSNMTIPIIVSAPDGTPKSVNVSVTGYKDMSNWQFTPTALVTNQNVTGIGELVFNSSDLGSTGEYAFAIEAAGGKTEEWKWPMATVRGFLVDGDVGEAMYISNFNQLDIKSFRWDTEGVKIVRIQQDARNSTPEYRINGVLGDVYERNPWEEGCEFFDATGNVTDHVLSNLLIYGFLGHHTDNHGYFFYNSTDGVLYRNETDCWFNVSATQTTYQIGSYITIEKEGTNFNASILTIDRNMYNYENRTDEDVFFGNTSHCHSFDNTPVSAVFSVSNTTDTVLSAAYNYTSSTICINSTAQTNSTYNITYQTVGRSWRADFGVAGVDASVILPMANDQNNIQWALQWGYMQNVSIFGTYYDIILANDTYNYQRCSLEASSDGQCAKKAWMVSTAIGNFSDPQTKGVIIGENFTDDLYLASVGPNDGDGISVGNFSGLELNQLPSIGMLPLADNTASYFAVLNETVLGYDLDKNASTNKTFYMLAFDSDFNGEQKLTSNLIDDDLELMHGSLNIEGTETPYDFTGAESGTDERWGGLPTGIYGGHASFGEENNNMTDEQRPSWNVPLFNSTDKMVLRKHAWRINETQPVDILLKIFSFDQTPIQGANLSVTKVARASWFGFSELEKDTDYSVITTHNVTDQYGYGLLKVSPATSWQTNANYQVVMNIETLQGNETLERWFCVGGCEW